MWDLLAHTTEIIEEFKVCGIPSVVILDSKGHLQPPTVVLPSVLIPRVKICLGSQRLSAKSLPMQVCLALMVHTKEAAISLARWLAVFQCALMSSMSWFHASAGQLVHFKSEGRLLLVMSNQVLVEHVSFTFDIERAGFPPHHTTMCTNQAQDAIIACASLMPLIGAWLLMFHIIEVHRLHVCPKWLSHLRFRPRGGRYVRHDCQGVCRGKFHDEDQASTVTP